MELKPASHPEFWDRVFPRLQQLMPSLIKDQCDYKIIVPFKGGTNKSYHIGMYEREFNKTMFVMMVESKNKNKLSELYTSLFMLKGKSKDSYTSSEKEKYEVPLHDLGIVLSYNEVESLILPFRNQSKDQLALFPVPVATTEDEPKGRAETINEYNHVNPNHYKSDSGIEVIDVIRAFFGGSFALGNTFKYIARAGKKPETPVKVDLKKANWYLIEEMKKYMSNEEIKEYLQREIIEQQL